MECIVRGELLKFGPSLAHSCCSLKLSNNFLRILSIEEHFSRLKTNRLYVVYIITLIWHWYTTVPPGECSWRLLFFADNYKNWYKGLYMDTRIRDSKNHDLHRFSDDGFRFSKVRAIGLSPRFWVSLEINWPFGPICKSLLQLSLLINSLDKISHYDATELHGRIAVVTNHRYSLTTMCMDMYHFKFCSLLFKLIIYKWHGDEIRQTKTRRFFEADSFAQCIEVGKIRQKKKIFK